MRTTVMAFLTAAAIAGATHVARAEGATCNATVSEKKLAGAAKNSFLKKCQADAQVQCDSTAASKKLAGAAKNSFTKKCVTDVMGF